MRKRRKTARLRCSSGTTCGISSQFLLVSDFVTLNLPALSPAAAISVEPRQPSCQSRSSHTAAPVTLHGDEEN